MSTRPTTTTSTFASRRDLRSFRRPAWHATVVLKLEAILGDAGPAGPNLYAYLDHRQFISDWFDWKKLRNPRFSHRLFARMAGQKSPSLLRHVVRGERNLTPATSEAFANAMKLGAAQRVFFQDLVELNQATSHEARNRAWERIAATRRFREARKLDGASMAYLSHWYYPAIRELAHRPDFEADPTWIRTVLRPRITKAEAARALSTLLTMGLLDEAGQPAEASVVTPHEVAGLAAHNYHRGMLERARDSITAFDPEERHLSALTLAIPEALLPRLKEEIVQFQEHVLNLCDSATEPAERVVQVQVQLFPLSDSRTS